MSSNADDYDIIREYLLGRLTDEDREEFARRFFADEELFEKLQAGEADLIDDFLSGSLSQDDVDMFHKNFLVGSKREREVRIGKAWRNYAAAHAGEKRPKPVPDPVSHWWQIFSSPHAQRIGAVAGLILVTAFVVWLYSASDVDKALEALNAALRQERPLESRITRLDYSRFVSTRDGGSSNVNQSDLSRAEYRLLDILATKPTPAAHYALGKVYLAKKEFDKAIEQFEEALKGDPDNAQLYADLGAALFEKGKLEIARAKTDRDSAESGRGVEYFARSLKNLNKALERDNKLLEALFNRALLHESMGPLTQAEEDWRKYLEKDPNSKWADEARERLTQIEQQRKKTSETNKEIFQRFLRQIDSGDEEGISTTVSSYQNRSGNVVVEQLIDIYLEAAAQNQKDDAGRAIQQLSYVGDLQIRKGGDRFFYDLAHFYRSTTPKQRELALAARELMKKGYAVWGKGKSDENLSLFETARDLFEQAGAYPEARVAEYWVSFCHYNKHRQEEPRQILDPLLLACENLHYLWLQSRALYLLSAIEFKVNEHSKAKDLGLRSAEIATRLNDPVGLLNATGALMDYYRTLGSYPKSLACIQRSLPLVTSTALDPVQATRHYSLAALAFMTMGLPDAAAGYQREALRLALITGTDAVKSYTYAFLGAIQGKQKNFDEALKNAQLAFDIAEANSSEGRTLMAYSALQMGHIYRDAGDLNKAIARYTQSIDIYKANENLVTHLYQAHKGRLLSYLQQQNDQSAQAEILLLRDLTENYRSKISDESYRNTFFDVEQGVVDAVIDFEYSRMNNPEQAFNQSNLSRARSLFDLLNGDKEVTARVQDPDIKFNAVSEPRSLETIKAQLPEQAQVVQYVVLENKLLIWVISRNDSKVVMTPISRKDLNEKLRRYLNIISHPPKDDEPQELLLAKELYAILIQPVEPLLNKQKLLCIIPDGTLSYLPFAALVSPESSRYFFEDHRLMTSPSPSVFLSCSDNAAQKRGPKEETILSVGNPTFDRTAFPNFDDLPEASSEAVEVGRHYKSHVLIEQQATRAAVKSEIERSDVIHLALHSNVDDEFPLRSKLLLAKTKTDTPKTKATDQISESVVYAYEIYNLKLSNTRLVVLSSCQSGAGRYYGGEGVSSLARAFLGAGVPLVVASLWPVETSATERLMVSFHSHRTSENISTVEALRSAQHDALRGPAKSFRRPYYWAAFAVTGGYAEF